MHIADIVTKYVQKVVQHSIVYDSKMKIFLYSRSD